MGDMAEDGGIIYRRVLARFGNGLNGEHVAPPWLAKSFRIGMNSPLQIGRWCLPERSDLLPSRPQMDPTRESRCGVWARRACTPCLYSTPVAGLHDVWQRGRRT